ncbi:MAG: histidinol-phosphate aminotransferase, partial [Candidatus Neomarinimicrobiota bacterium]
MKPPVELVREAIRQRKLYTLPRGKYIAKLNQNENPYEVPDSIKEEILKEIKRKSWNRYPDLTYSELKEEIAEWQKVAKERIVIG